MLIREALEMLELERPTDHEAVRRSFRRLVKVWHPDRFTDAVQKEKAHAVFLRLREAHDLLLKLSEAQINHTGPERRSIPRVRRSTSPAPPPPPVFDHPLIHEADNLARLFRLLDPQVKRSAFWTRWSQGKYSPGALMGKLYELFIERRFAGEDRLSGFAYGLFRAFHILWGTTVLIVAFIAISLGGLILAVVLFPPFMAFLSVYMVYHHGLKRAVQRLNKQIIPGNRASWIKARKAYLQLRSIPLFPMACAAGFLVFAGQQASYYFQSLTLAFSLMVLCLMLSVLYEWLHYFKMRNSTS